LKHNGRCTVAAAWEGEEFSDAPPNGRESWLGRFQAASSAKQQRSSERYFAWGCFAKKNWSA
jgi:hypothetical protein